MIRQNYDVT